MSSAAPGQPQQHGARSFGGFSLGGLNLAVAMHELREVQPCIGLQPLAHGAPAVAGGLPLRGVLLPVLDLRVLLGQASAAAAAPNVVVMVHAGCLVGLLADAVTGIFEADARGLQRAGPAAEPPLVCGSLRRGDDDSLCEVLDAAALFGRPGLPCIVDPEPGRAARQEAAGAAHDTAAASQSLMLVRCGTLALALDAMLVHSTLPAVTLKPSACVGGACRGVIDWQGQQVPALDLAVWCGFKPQPANTTQGQQPAFLVALPTGLVAFLIDAVLDVVPVAAAQVVPVPALGQPLPGRMAGVLTVRALGDALRARLNIEAKQFMVIDSQHLRQDADVLALAGMAAAQVGHTGPSAGAAHEAGQARFITYELNGETATPIDQLCEILAYDRQAKALSENDALLDIMVERGRAIPVFCLSRLTGLPPPRVTPAASVLVVESHDALVGFAVPRLSAIETAHWQPRLSASAAGGVAQTLVLLGTGAQERMSPVLDLQALAAELQQRAAA